MAIWKSKREYNLLLMGKTGHGKSSTGNSIIGRKQFKAMGGGAAVTKEFQCGYTDCDEYVIKVVDVPGVMDTEKKTREDQNNLVIEAIKNGFKQFPMGFDALLLVMSFTDRITEEEKEAIRTLKCIMGEDVLKKHTILVFTHGYSFYDNLGDDADFQEWCNTQIEYRDLFHECEWRCVLFENLTRDKNLKESQLAKLISEINKLKSRYDHYTKIKFDDAENVRTELKRDALLSERYSRNAGLIQDRLHKILASSDENKLEKLAELKIEASILMNDLCKEDDKKFQEVRRVMDQVILHLDSFGTLLNFLKEREDSEKALNAKLENQKMLFDGAIQAFQEQNNMQRPTEIVVFPIHRIVPGIIEGFTTFCDWLGSKID